MAASGVHTRKLLQKKRNENRVSAKVHRGVLWYTPIFFPEKFEFLQGFGVYQSTPREKWGFRGCR